jgi:hypothetical protein
MTQSYETVKTVTDAASIVTVIGTLAEVLPAMAAIFTIVWTLIRIYETRTVQKLLGKSKLPPEIKDVKCNNIVLTAQICYNKMAKHTYRVY